MNARVVPCPEAQYEPELPRTWPMVRRASLVAVGLLGFACLLSSIIGCQMAGQRPVEEKVDFRFGMAPLQWAEPADTVVRPFRQGRGPKVPEPVTVLARDGKPIVQVRDVYPRARGPNHTLLVLGVEDEARQQYLGLVAWGNATPSTKWVARMRRHEFVETAAISPDGEHVVMTITLIAEPPRSYHRVGVLRGDQLQLSEPVSLYHRDSCPIWWRDSRHVLFIVPSLGESIDGYHICTIRVLDTQTSRSWPLVQGKFVSPAWTVLDSRDGLLLTAEKPSGLHVILRVSDDLHGVDTLYTWQEEEETVDAQVSPSGDMLGITRVASDSAGEGIWQTVLRDLGSGAEVVLDNLVFEEWHGDTFLAHESPGNWLGCYSTDGGLLWSWSPVEGAGPSPRPEG